MKRRALLSVSDKRGLEVLARALVEHGFELISTGGTAKALQAAGLEVTLVEAVTGSPEMMDGRVKTLHPRIHGGLLGRWDDANDRAQAAANGIEPISLLVVNLYPFAETIARPGCSDEDAIENIDVGGPAMLRGAAKNHAHTAVVVDPEDYAAVVATLPQGPPLELRRRLATKAFAHTAAYDASIATWMAGGALLDTLALGGPRQGELRYGENPHQSAGFYALPTGPNAASLSRATQLGGKALSYNNLLDLDAALRLAVDLGPRGAVVVKHTNPCGAAEAQGDEPLASVYARARSTDPTSAFGGIVGLNATVDDATAACLAETFLEAVIAPDFEPAALARLGEKKNLRLIRHAPWPTTLDALDVRSVAGGLLVQRTDAHPDSVDAATCVTARAPTPAERAALDLAWRVARHVKSNAIVLARAGQVLGVGAGQMSRVDSSRLAVEKARAAGHDLAGCVVASDAFFPFPDALELAAAAGATAAIQPGGSVRDAEVIALADRLGLAMLCTGVRHFRH